MILKHNENQVGRYSYDSPHNKPILLALTSSWDFWLVYLLIYIQMPGCHPAVLSQTHFKLKCPKINSLLFLSTKLLSQLEIWSYLWLLPSSSWLFLFLMTHKTCCCLSFFSSLTNNAQFRNLVISCLDTEHLCIVLPDSRLACHETW